jgi:demethylmenaquinone methyltransferase/2-methoxy-6-polyprenyl-1,4-benzoquinol methylase
MNTDNRKYLDKKKEAWKIFDSIFKRYDLLNHLLSFGQDFLWRRQIVRVLNHRKDIRLLDIATGTCDVLINFLRIKDNDNIFTCGMDMSLNMLKYGEKKLLKHTFKSKWSLFRSDANLLPLPDNEFNIITIAFGIRNMIDPKTTLKEMHRVLDFGGEVLILEFSLPKNIIIKKLHLFYLRIFIPFLGRIISGDLGAYKYLNKTIETFPYGEEFIEIMKTAGFSNCSRKSMTFGAVTLYQGKKE